MKTVYTSLGLVAGASAAALVPRDSCCFGLTASGGVSGSVGQLSDGQNRIGQTGGLANQNGQYCINNGQITDGNGRGCILTPPTTQFQCDSGASPTGGFSVDNNGNLASNGNTQFYACPTGDNGGYNVYTQSVAGQQGCVTVTLSTGGQCSGSGSGSSSAAGSASSAPAASAPASSAPAGSAPAASSPGAGVSSAASSIVSQASSVASFVSSAASVVSSDIASSPAASAPASGPATMTIWSTQYQTVTSCGASVTNCPADSTVVRSSVIPMTTVVAGTAPAGSAPAGSAPAGSAPAASAPAASAPAGSAPASSAPAGSSPAASAPAASGTAPSSASGSACQTALTGAYQTPHAIIPVNQNSPDQSYGTQYNAYIGGGNSTIFNFDIPSSYSGKQCSVVFLFPEQSQLETSGFTQSGSGGLTFEQLSSVAGLDVTYNSAPKGQTQLAQISSVTPGNSYVVATGSCPAGTTESIEVSSTGDFSLEFFEDWNPSPIGVFITSC